MKTKIANEATTVYHYDRFGNLIAESDQLGNFGSKYVYLNDLRLNHIAPNEEIFYYVNDHLGTPQKIFNAGNTVVWSADYLPFGEVNLTVNTITNNHRFPGQYFDQETGNYYNPK